MRWREWSDGFCDVAAVSRWGVGRHRGGLTSSARGHQIHRHGRRRPDQGQPGSGLMRRRIALPALLSAILAATLLSACAAVEPDPPRPTPSRSTADSMCRPRRHWWPRSRRRPASRSTPATTTRTCWPTRSSPKAPIHRQMCSSPRIRLHSSTWPPRTSCRPSMRRRWPTPRRSTTRRTGSGSAFRPG